MKITTNDNETFTVDETNTEHIHYGLPCIKVKERWDVKSQSWAHSASDIYIPTKEIKYIIS